MTSRPLYKLSLVVPHALIDHVVSFFENQDFQGISWFEKEDSEPLDLLDESGFPIASLFVVEGYTETQIDLTLLDQNLHTFLKENQWIEGEDIRFKIHLELVKNEDWLELCYATLPPKIAGTFYIYGSHIKDPPPDLYIPLCVDAATAFGSGDHPTTEGCLVLLSRLQNIMAPQSILDMGCGSGILGIACKKLFHNAKVILSDIEAEALTVSRRNANLNQVDTIHYLSDGFSNQALLQEGPYDLILCNILAQPLFDLAPFFKQVIHKNGYVIVSGFLRRHRPMIEDCYAQHGFRLFSDYTENDWVALTFQQ